MAYTPMASRGSDEESSFVCEPCQTLFEGALDGWDLKSDIANPFKDHRREIELTGHSISDSSPCRVCRLLHSFVLMQPIPQDPLLRLTWAPCRIYQMWMEVKESSTQIQPAAYFSNPDARDQSSNLEALIQVSRSTNTSNDLLWHRRYPPNLDFCMVTQALRECKSSHGPECRPGDTSRLINLRVIDCETGRVVKADGHCQFVALSYVWGRSDINATLERLPPTIEQSIYVTKRLGYRFLWVDQFCIDQNDKENQHLQITQMGHIYAAAQLTIIDAAGFGLESGLPGVVPGSRQPRIQTRVDDICLTLLPSARGLADVRDSRWATRGWTFQETILSRRRLIFTPRQTIYLCNSKCFFEADAGIIQDTISDHACLEALRVSSHLKNTIHQARVYLAAYSARDLSFETDALNAILGALNTIEGLRHLWGVPLKLKEDSDNAVLYIDLMWYHLRPARRRYGFPSWSSIGWSGEINSASEDDPCHVMDLSIIHAERDTSVETLNQTSIGRCLKVVAMSANAWLIPETDFEDLNPYLDDDSHSSPSIPFRVLLPCTRTIYACYKTQWDVDPATFACKSWIKCIDVAAGHKEALLLVVPKGDQFERVGLVSFSRSWPPLYAESKKGFVAIDSQELTDGEREAMSGWGWLQYSSKRETIQLV